ncbi:MAG: DegT/DnrJ/EryC1/StrS family aminotransferase, partial [Candidatus Marinimicrobia bacterium]|nr:DegT/DnrJ/EryC1/StrS family aminotransferase [Candidatus Neomarinimicrobiota bacterium]
MSASADKPAVLGGSPVIERAEWPTWPPRLPEINAALNNVITNDQWGVGSQAVEDFEQAFCGYQEAQYGIAMTNCTVALYAALAAFDIGPGDEVIIPAYTFMATAAAIIQVGATPVFADIDPLTYNLDPDATEAAVNSHTRAIIPVHIGGNPADMEAFKDLAAKYNLALIEDAAQAPGAMYGDRKVGAIGDLGCFSFQSSKNLTAGEGGILLTNDEHLYDKIFQVYNCGRTLTGPWYEHVYPGLNFRISAFQAAVLNAQMPHLEGWVSKREENGLYLEGLLNEIEGWRCLGRYAKTGRNAYHLQISAYNPGSFSGLPKKKFLAALLAEG